MVEPATDPAQRQIERALWRSDLLPDLATALQDRLRLDPDFSIVFRDCEGRPPSPGGQRVEVCFTDLAGGGEADEKAIEAQAIWALLPGLHSAFGPIDGDDDSPASAAVLLVDLWQPGSAVLAAAAAGAPGGPVDPAAVRCYLSGRNPPEVGREQFADLDLDKCTRRYRRASGAYREALSSRLLQPQSYDWWLAREVRHRVADQLGTELAEATPSALLREDLGADSMDVFEIWATIVEELNVTEDRGRAFESVGDILIYADHIYFEGERLRGPPGEGEFYPQLVFYSTDRAPTGSTAVDQHFGGARGQISYGASVVAVPKSVYSSSSDRREWLRITSTSRIVVESILPLERDPFFEMIEEVLHAGPGDGDWSNDVLVFVHGYNVRFHHALIRTAQIAYDFGFDGAAVLFSWPSDGRKKSYMADGEDVLWSVPHFSAFLEDLRARTAGSDIHLIAHSMGSVCMLRALERLAIQRGDDSEPLFENVVLTAADFDAQVFREQLAASILPLARRWTLYASEHDLALKLSAGMRDAKRLGSPITVVEGVDSVDASAIEASLWSVPEQHSYFATVPTVASDLNRVLLGADPESRLLKRATTPDRLEYWKIPAPRE